MRTWDIRKQVAAYKVARYGFFGSDGHIGDTAGIARRTVGSLDRHRRNYNPARPANIVFGYGGPHAIQVVGKWDGYGELLWHLRNYNSSVEANTMFGYGGYSEIIVSRADRLHPASPRRSPPCTIPSRVTPTIE